MTQLELAPSTIAAPLLTRSRIAIAALLVGAVFVVVLPAGRLASYMLRRAADAAAHRYRWRLLGPESSLTGYAGQLVSLSTSAFMAVGAFAAYNFNLRVPGLPFLISFSVLGAGVVTAAAVGVAVRVAQPSAARVLPRRLHAGGAVLRSMGADQVSAGSPTTIRLRA